VIAMASMVKLRVRRGFRDLQAQCYRPTGEVFVARAERAQVLVAAGVAEIVEVLAAPEPSDEPAAEEAPKKKRRRKGDA